MNNNKILFLGFLVPVVYVLPLIILGENSHLAIHDNLDNGFVWLKILSESGKIFAGNQTIIPNIMNGLPRFLWDSEFNPILWLFYLFGPFWGYAVNQLIIRILAFFGLFLLLKNNNHWLLSIQTIVGLSAAFSLLPFYPMAGLTVAGQPMLFNSLLNIRAGRNGIWNWIFLAIFSLYSNFVFSGFFILIALGVLFLWSWLKSGNFNKPLFWAVIGLGIITILVNYRLFMTFLFPGEFVSHRTEFVNQNNINSPLQLFIKFFLLFIKGQYHTKPLQQWIILPTVFITLAFNLFYGQRKIASQIIKVLCIIALISFFSAFYHSEYSLPLKKMIPIFRVFQFDRFYFLLPVMWFGLFAFVLSQWEIRWRGFVMLLLIGQIGIGFSQHTEITSWQEHLPTYKAFFASRQFAGIEKTLNVGQSHPKIACIGFHPAVAQFNGWYTLDGYMTNYPLEYKHQFGRIIEPELEKNSRIYNSFHFWGSRCYFFSAELGYDFLYTRDRKVGPIDYKLDSQSFRELGGEYIFSSVPIANFSQADEIRLITIDSNISSAWNIYVYQVLSVSADIDNNNVRINE